MSADIYDPSAPEGDLGARSQYISKKDIKILFAIIFVAMLILYPIYLMGVRNSERARCTTNIGAIFKAMGMYAAEHDDRLPPVYRVGNDGISPAVSDKGLVWTFASDIYGYKTSRASFACPSAKESELVPTESPDGSRFDTSYGMYLPYGTFVTTEVPDPSRTVILAETTNAGALGSFDPNPLKPDGFVITWNNSNERPNRQTDAVTRLAYRDAAKDPFAANVLSRHDKGIHAITASGSLLTLQPKDARVVIQPSTGLPTGTWAVP